MTTRILCKPGKDWYYGYIYRTENKPKGMFYIGKRKGRFHPAYFGSSTPLNEDICEQGLQDFHIEILAYAYSKEELSRLESKYLLEYKAVENENYYNESGPEEFIPYSNPNSNKEQYINMRGNKNPSFICGTSSGVRSRRSSQPKVIPSMDNPNYELWKKLSGKNNYQSISIVQLDEDGKFIKEWDCLADAHREGFRRKSIKKVLDNTEELYKGFRWVRSVTYFKGGDEICQQ